MAARFSDLEITQLLAERKLLPDDYQSRIQLKNKRGHREQELDIQGVNQNQFRIILRRNDINTHDFSVILAFFPRESKTLFRLRRYNGKSHEHTNHIERQTFYDFHIHTATQRYQEYGTREDAFAETTDRYADYFGALQCLLDDCGFVIPPNSSEPLLEGIQP